MKTQHSILIVDDEPVARRTLASVLERRGHEVREAGDGNEALAMMDDKAADMVISDIQMPAMDGFGLLARLKRAYPGTRRVLITACDIDSYVSYMREQDVGNVLAKGGGMSMREMVEYLEALLSGDILGLGRYFEHAEIHQTDIRSYNEARAACATIVETQRAREPLFLEMAVDELISNAVFHGVLEGLPRSDWSEGFELPGDASVRVSWASDEVKVGVSVADPRGRLRKHDVLKWLEAPLRQREGPDEHGRGLLLVRRLIDRFVVNIVPNVTTECIVLQYHEGLGAGAHKPLLVHEL